MWVKLRQTLTNERGAMFMLGLVLLLFVSAIISTYSLYYERQLHAYEMLEKSNVRATIKLLTQKSQ